MTTDEQKQVQQNLQHIAALVANELPKDFGFTILIYDHGKTDNNRLYYVSNSNRNDVVKSMKEWIATVDNKSYGKDLK